MKKIFTLLFMGMALAANATDYTDDLTVTVGTATLTSETTVSLTQAEDGTYTFTLPDLYVKYLVMNLAVGTIEITGIEGTDMGNGNILLSAEENVTIQDGSDEDETVTWVGSGMEVPVTFGAVLGADGTLYAEMSLSITYQGVINIDASAVFGSPVVEEYTGTLTAVIGDGTITEEDNVYLTYNADGTYTFTLKNFVLYADENSPMGVGTINITGIEGTDVDGVIDLAFSDSITIDDGDVDSPSGYWLGSMLGPVPVTLSGTMDDGIITLNLSIEAPIGTITVNFTTAEDTGIQSVNAATTAKDGAAYTIGGVKAPASYKGIVIQNGRKVIAK
ncbi:MAG: calycin-like domain-containing protein [Prevotella sp.]|nr:calycin-like domain-containing protein [Prevotella sp.]